MKYFIFISLLLPSIAFASDATFTISGASVAPGTGEKVISQFYSDDPTLKGQGGKVETALNGALGGFAQQFQTAVNQRLSQLHLGNFLNSMAGAGGMSAKTMPVDYASDDKLFSLSVGGGVSANLQEFSNFNAIRSDAANGNLPAIGAMPYATILLGVNLQKFDLPTVGFFDPKRLSVFVNGGYFNHNFGVGSDNVNVDYKNFGLHGQYRLINDYSVLPAGLLRWGGIQVATGFDYASMGAGFNAKLAPTTQSSPFNFQGKTLQTDLSYDGLAAVNASFTNWSVPLEVMTSAQLLYLLTLYVGGAADLNFGSANINANAKTNLNITLSGNNKVTNISNPVATLNMHSIGRPTLGDFRGFVGAQVNLFVLALYAQGNIDTAQNVGANVGLRVFW